MLERTCFYSHQWPSGGREEHMHVHTITNIIRLVLSEPVTESVENKPETSHCTLSHPSTLFNSFLR